MRTIFRSYLTGLAGLASFGLLAANSMAQDDEPSLMQENKRVMVMAADNGSGAAPLFITSSSVDGMPATFSFAGPGLAGNQLSIPMIDFGPMDPLGLIHNPDIQKEIELDKQQIDDYKKLQSEFQKQVESFTTDLQDGQMDRERMREFGASMKKLRDDQTARVKEMLLPHQFERLQQISTQQYLESAGTANALASKALMEQLGLTEEQIERLKKRSEEVSKELKEKIEAAQAEAKEKILSELTSEQREKLTAMTGKKYTFPKPDLSKFAPRMRQRSEARPDRDDK
jgi:hypothetical protein